MSPVHQAVSPWTSDIGRAATPSLGNCRIYHLDAARAFALTLGILFHACLSFSPFFMGWAVQDISTSTLIPESVIVSHSFRMELFFLLAGFLGCVVVRRKGVGDYVRTRALRIGVPFVAGWFILRPLVVSGWIMGSASMRGDYDFWTGIKAGFQTLHGLPTGLFTGTHLWFLYYLILITALALGLRGALVLTGGWGDAMLRRADLFTAWLARSSFSLPVLVAPMAGALWFMRFWGMDTPDQSLLPNFQVLVVYGGFFALGWMFSRQADAFAAFVRLSIARCVIAFLATVAALRLSEIQGNPSHPHFMAAHLCFVVSYATMMWTLVALTIGIFEKLCQQPRPWVRYVADSSYWLYLVHLPIVVWLQVAVAEFPLHWSIKLTFLCGATMAIALISYDLFVRSTSIGWLLNGRRHERALADFFPAAFRLTGKTVAASGSTPS